MIWIEQGGVLMWPLLALSIATIAILIERGIVFTTFFLPDEEKSEKLIEALRRNDVAAARDLAGNPALNSFIEALGSDEAIETRERAVTVRIEEIVRELDRRLGLLSIAARVAPLLGLLGTVLGMINTFSQMSSSRQGAIDMTMLADGIWQALLTTAAGLSIAIPAVIAHQAFLRREDAVSFALGRIANLVLSRGKGFPTP